MLSLGIRWTKFCSFKISTTIETLRVSSPQRSVLLQTAFLWALSPDPLGFVTSGETRLFTLITALIRNCSKGPRGGS